MRQDVFQQLADYRGVLHWDSFDTYSDGIAITRPAIDLPLYIKDHPIPIRKPRVSEIVTTQNVDPWTQKSVHAHFIFFGTSDILQLQLSGWIITPTLNKRWNPTVDGSPTGTSLNVGNISYAEIVSAFIEGRMDQTSGGAWKRRDPDYYIDPHGRKYLKPKISLWDVQYTVNMRKQTFNMTLYLES